MARWLGKVMPYLIFTSLPLLWHSGYVAAQPVSAPEARDMALVGAHDLQGRSAYQPIIQQQGGRFIAYIGHHGGSGLNPLHGKLVFISYFNAGVRAVDIRDPYRPQEVAFYIPAITEKTDKRCVPLASAGEACKVAIQTNNVEVDDRGYIYIVDRANTGLHILELTGAARAIANFP